MKKYEILEKLGQGGMGVVYKAFQKNLNREVAIKILPKAYSENPEVKRRFVSEMQICGGLVHPNIIRIYDNGEQDGTLYYVMEHIQGTTLLELVQSKGPMPVEQAMKVTNDLLEAMRYYHPMGLVHRDIKPANIMVKDVTHEAVLMDFGLVKALYASGITIQGRLVGTPRYMSPEMLRGGAIDGRSDIFQLGLVLYEMVAGVPAFRGKDRQEVTRKLMEEEPERPSQLNPLVDVSLEHLISNAIDKNIDSRYQSADEMLEDLTTIREGGRIGRRAGARPLKTLGSSDSGASGEVLRPADSPRDEAASPPQPLPGSRSSVAIEVPTSDLASTLAKVLFAFLAVLVGAVALAMWPGLRPDYSAREVRCEPDFTEARIRWSSDTPYPTRLEYGENEALLQPVVTADESQARTSHSVVVKGLKEGTEYVYRIGFPDRRHSQLFEFKTPALYFTSSSVRRSALDAVEVAAQTSADVRTRLEFRKGDEEGSLQGPAEASRGHRFALDRLDLEKPVRVRLVAIGKSGAEKAGDWMDAPAPIALARAVASATQAFPARDWYAQAEKWVAERKEPRFVAQKLDELWKAMPAARLLRGFQEIGPAFLASPDVPLVEKLQLFNALGPIGDFNHYCDLRRVPFHAPADECLPEAFSPSAQGRVKTSEIYKRDLVNPFGFTPTSVSAPKATPAGTAASTSLVLVKLDRAREIRSAEVLLAVDVKDPLTVFEVQINGRLTLRFRQPATMLGRPVAALFHTFDPRLLIDGDNRFTLQLVSLAGPRAIAGSHVRFLAMLVRR
ncbi:MAG: protein kinase [Candidatus Wallbacteria bacterium]|nr:protein kinase [Candidatus Wallbacteria bacterium]